MCAEDGEVDMRFTYCAACIAYFLNDWSGINVDKAVNYIASSQGYDGGIAQGECWHGAGEADKKNIYFWKPNRRDLYCGLRCSVLIENLKFNEIRSGVQL